MARIHPFRGYRYNVAQIDNPAAVVSPPYDVISGELRHALHLRHPCNVIRLILGEDRAGDDGSENRYLRARRYFEEWEARGTLCRDAHPGFYIYRQEYPWKWGERRVRTGLIGVVGLEEYSAGVILPHEQTMPGPKADRLRLLQALPVNLEQIFCFYPGPAQPIRNLCESAVEGAPLYDFSDGDAVRHRVWAIREPEALTAIQQAFQDRRLIIADGHHRYETALTFQKEMLAIDRSPSPLKAYNYVMMTLVSIEDEGLTVLPTHRLVTLPRHQAATEILQALAPDFHVERRLLSSTDFQKCLQEMEDRSATGHVLGLYAGGPEFCLLILRDRGSAREIIAPESSRGLKALDVVILHRLVFRTILGLHDDSTITFTPDEHFALEEVRSGRYTAAFFLAPTPVGQVVERVMAGERLPPKTTYFYPKLVSGLVFHKLDSSESLEGS